MQPTKEDILSAILASDWMKEEQAERSIEQELKETLEEQDSCQRLIDYKIDKIREFFDQPVEDIIAVAAVWQRLSNELKMDYNKLWEEKKAVIGSSQNAQDYLIGERKISTILEAIQKEVARAYREQLEKEWKGLTLPATIKKLKELNLPPLVFAVIQDDQGVTIDEPYPITGNVNKKLSGDIHLEKSRFPQFPDEMYLTVTHNPPMTLSIGTKEETFAKESFKIKKEGKKVEFVTI